MLLMRWNCSSLQRKAMSCLVKMRAVRDELSANEKKIAEFILANSALIRDYSSQHLAGSIGVSQSSIVKFSQKLGYRGFTDLKLAIHEAVVKSESENNEINKRKHRSSGEESLQDQLYHLKQEALISTMELNDEKKILSAVKVLESGKRIQIVALGAGSPVARNFASMLVRLGKLVIAEMDTYGHLASVAMLGKGDVVFVISFSGQSTIMIRIAKQAKKAGVTVISLTSYSANPIKSLADVQLFSVVGQEGKFEIPQIIASTSQQHVVDLLFSMLVKRDRRGKELLLRSQKMIESLV